MISYSRQHISETDIEAVVQVLRSDFITQGQKVPEFEMAVAERCNARHAVAVSSGTAALHLACLALKLKAGDWFWTVPNTFVATANVARQCGAQVDFVDIDPATGNLSLKALKKKLKQDNAKISVSQFSEFGLMQITRQRIGLSLLHSLTDECDGCHGLGRTLSKDTTLTSIQNWIKRYKTKFRDRRLILYVNENMYNYFKTTRKNSIAKLIFKNWIWIESKIDPNLLSNQYRVYSKSRKKDVTNEV